MRTYQTTLPLFSRIVVLAISLVIAVVLVVIAVQEFRQNYGPDIVSGFLWFVAFTWGCGGIWFSLFCKNGSAKELAEELSFPSIDKPDIPDDALVFRFPNARKSAAIHVDVAGRMIHFHNCHTPRKFVLSGPVWFSCPVDDIHGCHVFKYRGDAMSGYIATAAGKTPLIPGTEPAFQELRDTIQEVVPFPRPGRSADHPMVGMVYLFGALAGLFGGALLTPNNANDSTLRLFVLCGTILGAAGSILLVWTYDRFLKTSVVQI
jgi:hypothetical protein